MHWYRMMAWVWEVMVEADIHIGSGYVLKEAPIGLADGSDVRARKQEYKREFKNDSKVF